MSSTESNMEVEDEEEELLLKVPESDISVDEGEEEELLKVDKETSKSKHALKKIKVVQRRHRRTKYHRVRKEKGEESTEEVRSSHRRSSERAKRKSLYLLALRRGLKQRPRRILNQRAQGKSPYLLA